jgi:hypothetical protein
VERWKETERNGQTNIERERERWADRDFERGMDRQRYRKR